MNPNIIFRYQFDGYWVSGVLLPMMHPGGIYETMLFSGIMDEDFTDVGYRRYMTAQAMRDDLPNFLAEHGLSLEDAEK